MQHGRQDHSDPEARKPADHQSEQSAKYEETRRSHLEDTRRKNLEENHRAKYKETCRGNVHYRIQGFPHSTVQKEDFNRKEIEKRLIKQLENHPNRDSFVKDLNKTEELNPFSEKSKEFITSMGNTEYFELCEISSKIQCRDCSLYWEAGIENCTCGTCIQPSERNRQSNTASLCQILDGLRNRSFNTMKSWKLSLNAERTPGPLNQCSDFQEAKQTCKRLYHEFTAITGIGNKSIPPEQQIRQRLDQQFDGLEEYNYRLEASTR